MINENGTKNYFREANYNFLKGYSKVIADQQLDSRNRAAVRIQSNYRGYRARKEYSQIIADRINEEEEWFYKKELKRLNETEPWVTRSRLRQQLADSTTLQTNHKRKRIQSAIRIQRAWREYVAKGDTIQILSTDVVTLLQNNFPDLCSDYCLPPVLSDSSTPSSESSVVLDSLQLANRSQPGSPPVDMVFSGIRSGSFSSTTSNANNQIVKSIIPNNNNMSLFGDLKMPSTTGFSFTTPSRHHNNPFSAPKTPPEPLSADFNTPVPAKRKIIETSYIFEKELREDFSNPYCLDSDSEDENEKRDKTVCPHDSEDEVTDTLLFSGKSRTVEVTSCTDLLQQNELLSSREDVRGGDVLRVKSRSADTLDAENFRMKLSSHHSIESRVSDDSLISSNGMICDSGFEEEQGDNSKSSSPIPRNKMLHTPSTVQMCFVEEDSGDEERNRASRDAALSKRWSNVSHCFSDIAPSSRSKPNKVPLKRPASYGGEDMTALKDSWRSSAHLMTVAQLNNYLDVMRTKFAKTNLELVEHLAERDSLRENQDMLLQKIFALKSIKETGEMPVKQEPPMERSSSLSRRLSSFFTKTT